MQARFERRGAERGRQLRRAAASKTVRSVWMRTTARVVRAHVRREDAGPRSRSASCTSRGLGRAGDPVLACVLTLFMALASGAARADTDMLALREKLEVERPQLRAVLQPWLRAAGATAFPADKPGAAWGNYLETAWRVTDARNAFPEVQAALRGFRGKLDPANAMQRQALGVMLGDYLQARYGDDLERELRTLVGFRTFDNVVDRNAENGEFKKCFDYLGGLAQALGLQVKNDAYSRLQITLPASGAAASAPALVLYTHADVVRVVERKWEFPPFELHERDGRLVGLGVYDDKGPLLVNLFALRALRDAGLQLQRPVTLLVASDGENLGSSVAANLEGLSPHPVLVLAADGSFPYASAEYGRLVARVSSARGMRSHAGIQPGEFYVHKIQCRSSANTVPAEARAWVRYAPPPAVDNPSLVQVNKWRGLLEAYQKEHPQSRYETYIQDDTLHFFVIGRPAHVLAADQAENSLYNLAGALLRMGLYENNSVTDLLQWIDQGLQRDCSGASLGLAAEGSDMGPTHVVPVGFERVADEVTLLVDIRYAGGHDAAWVKQRLAAEIAAFNPKYGTQLKLDWEPGGNEPVQQAPPHAIQALLQEAFVLASGDSAEPPAVVQSSTHVLPGAVPFGPEWPGRAAIGHTMGESISRRELQDLGTAYVSALAWLGAAALPAAP